MDREVLVDRFARDLDSAMVKVENGGNAASLFKTLHEKYVVSGVCKSTGSSKKMDEKSLEEMSRQRAVMERNLKGFERSARRLDGRNKRERQRMIEENTFLMQEINELRRESGLLSEQLRATQSQLAFSKTRNVAGKGSSPAVDDGKGASETDSATADAEKRSMLNGKESSGSGKPKKRKRGKLKHGAALTQAARIERERQREHQLKVLMTSMEEKEGIIAMQSAELRTLRAKLESMILSGAMSKRDNGAEAYVAEAGSSVEGKGNEIETVDMISRLKAFPQRTSKISASTPVLPLARR